MSLGMHAKSRRSTQSLSPLPVEHEPALFVSSGTLINSNVVLLMRIVLCSAPRFSSAFDCGQATGHLSLWKLGRSVILPLCPSQLRGSAIDCGSSDRSRRAPLFFAIPASFPCVGSSHYHMTSGHRHMQPSWLYLSLEQRRRSSKGC